MKKGLGHLFTTQVVLISSIKPILSAMFLKHVYCINRPAVKCEFMTFKKHNFFFFSLEAFSDKTCGINLLTDLKCIGKILRSIGVARGGPGGRAPNRNATNDENVTKKHIVSSVSVSFGIFCLQQ